MTETKIIAAILLLIAVAVVGTIGTTVGIGTAHAVLSQNDNSQGNNNNQASVCTSFRCGFVPGENTQGNQN